MVQLCKQYNGATRDAIMIHVILLCAVLYDATEYHCATLEVLLCNSVYVVQPYNGATVQRYNSQLPCSACCVVQQCNSAMILLCSAVCATVQPCNGATAQWRMVQQVKPVQWCHNGATVVK